MGEKREFLKEVYRLTSVDDTRRLYDAWAESYDQEVGGKGYATPDRLAAALAGLMDRALPVLDFGCGTGMSGAALVRAGFGAVDGCDLSEGMLAQARARGIYRELWQNEAGALDVKPGRYAAIVACGVVSIGAAPPETLDLIVEALAPGGFLAFSFNDHTFEDPRFEAKVQSCLAAGTAVQRLRETGDHLPGIGLNSTVFVLEKT